MPNRENILKWTEALRSGKYPQTTDVLRDENGYCCLGVACEVALNNGVNLVVEEDGDSGAPGSVSYDGNMSDLPRSVSEWLGLDTSNPRVTTPRALIDHEDYSQPRIELAELNDDYNDKIDFYGIASLIEKEFIGE